LFKLDGGQPPDEKHNLYNRYPEVAQKLQAYIDQIGAGGLEQEEGSGMTGEEEAIVEQHLRDLGYL
jgi:hypothetical protein